MQIGYPSRYPSTTALPFNQLSLEGNFQLSTPDQDPGTEGVWLLLNGSNVILSAETDETVLPTGELPCHPENDPLYIGNWQGRPCRMAIINAELSKSSQLKAYSLNAQNPEIPLPTISLAGVGLMIKHWEESSRHCGYCGSELQRLAGEWGKRCSSCRRQHYPRIHPCVIGLIVKGEEILLVRKPEWADGRFGLVAGFVEFGESQEEAMIREAKEETGLLIGNLRYLGSQSWPFPSQIMNGFVADYIEGELTLQEDELAEAAWFKLNNLPILPPRRSIARHLIDQAAKYIKA